MIKIIGMAALAAFSEALRKPGFRGMMRQRLLEKGWKQMEKYQREGEDDMESIREQLLRLGREQGFDHMAFLPVKELVFVEEYRKYCAENLCGNYDKLKNCPPQCGTAAQMRERAQRYDTAFIMQTICELDFSDEKAVKAMKARHNQMTRAVVKAMEERGVEGLTMSAGPTGESACMSAYCVDAAKMAESCGMAYWMGEKRAAFFSQFLFREPSETGNRRGVQG
ncbi:MAG: DUF2284 domain-containing protein [Candidatus Limivivens sp.]|nr:DUF2284 domain-containing protein [Candidatus Limivivens sp.]